MFAPQSAEMTILRRAVAADRDRARRPTRAPRFTWDGPGARAAILGKHAAVASATDQHSTAAGSDDPLTRWEALSGMALRHSIYGNTATATILRLKAAAARLQALESL